MGVVGRGAGFTSRPNGGPSVESMGVLEVAKGRALVARVGDDVDGFEGFGELDDFDGPVTDGQVESVIDEFDEFWDEMWPMMWHSMKGPSLDLWEMCRGPYRERYQSDRRGREW